LSKIRFYLDENVNPVVVEQLARLDVEAISVRDLDELGDSDISHLQRATKMGYVLCTHDQDFLRLAAETTDHNGIIFADHYEATIGGWVRALRRLHGEVNAEDIQGQVKYISVR